MPHSFLRNMIACAAVVLCYGAAAGAGRGIVAYDADRAMEICDSMALDNLEGVWVYPEDNVKVLVVRDGNESPVALRSYDIVVVESADCSLSPGDRIGRVASTSDPRKYVVTLFTGREGNVFTKPQECSGQLSSDGYALTLSREKKKKFRLRLNVNPSVLLPRLWRSLFRAGVSSSGSGDGVVREGMVKVYPSYDGNGSSRRGPRYL